VSTRVEFLRSLGAATTVATGGFDIWDPQGPQIRVLVAADTGGASPQVAVDGTFAFGGKRWRGAPSTIGMPGGRLALVTTIDVDDYLAGVLPLEASPSWPAAALQVQAIVARTYALGRRTLSRPYDVRADDGDQRWGGVEAEAPAASAAIQATRGRVLTYGGSAASVYYSSCCGGRTADVAAAWAGGPPPAYLRGVDDTHCSAAPDYRWTREVLLDRVLAAFGPRTGGTLASAALGDSDTQGRARAVVLSGTLQASVPVAEFRRALGYEVVRSTWLRGIRVEVTQATPRLVIEGSGRGHGVGLCQWGSRFYASSGASAAEILAFYFPGTSVSGG
jgi:stage II sporulation protein D